ncbi:trypsin-like serine protease [Luteimonas sp. S4-F44]|uniref:S1 family peptidase n=1 Tax=Luteimonas sp. S4-F44 TaxID=2925842 RepID=UPI001F52C885|nr:trypsin-like serine protease [Luteimonas sp. S4-F44]UNK42543.1 trypsin-like serine protease [Luteimonas sp. S4-F44]
MIRRLACAALLAACATASAIVVRDDVDDGQYRVPDSELPALVDMPGEGHGVLIAPNWVVTAAHTLPMQGRLESVVLGGRSREVADVVVHPGYRTLPQSLIDQAMASGEAMLIVVFLAGSDDIALIRLKQPVEDIVPVGLYHGSDEAGHVVKLLGKGATGTGATGHDPRGPNRTALRRAFNRVTSAHERWLCYVFDAPPAAIALEGALGNGDSGGPLLIETDGQWQLAGLGAWKVVAGDVRTARPGRYGQTTCNVRLSHYADWIEDVMSGQASVP